MSEPVLDRIKSLREHILATEAEIKTIQGGCDHEFSETEHDLGIHTYTVVESRCLKCDKFNGSWQKRREWVPE